MEQRAHFALIGGFVLLFLLGAVAFVAWLSNAQFDQQFDQYEVRFVGPVRGLSQGGEVRFNGLKVGEVTRLRLNAERTNEVIAEIQVAAETPVRTDSYAQLEPLGLTGLSYLQIFAGNENFPLFDDMPGSGPKEIPGRMSTLDNIFDGGESVLEGAKRALGRVNALLSPEAIQDFQGILSNINTITGRLEEAEIDAEAVSGLIESISSAADQVELTAEDLTRTLASVDEVVVQVDGMIVQDIRPALAKLEGTVNQVDQTLASFQTAGDNGNLLISDAREAINRLSNSGLTDIEETTDQLRRLVTSLNRIAESLEQSPTQFIVGTERKTIELPQ